MAKRSRRQYVTVDVDVSLDEFDTDDIIEHLKEEGYAVLKGGGAGFDTDYLLEVHAALMGRRIADAVAMLERIIWPKWQTPAACRNQYETFKKLVSDHQSSVSKKEAASAAGGP